MSKILLTPTVFLMIFTSSCQPEGESTSKLFGGNQVGNGGNVVQCPGRSDVTLDVYEVTKFWKFEPVFAQGETYIDVAISMLERLRTYDSIRQIRLKSYLESFESEAAFLENIDLPEVPDQGAIFLEKNCHLVQAIVQTDPKNFGKRYMINLDLWKTLGKENQVALALHEVLYREAIEHGVVENSLGVRRFNGLLIADRIKTLSRDYYLTFLRE